MNLVIRLQLVDDHGKEIKEVSGEIDNFTGRDSLETSPMIRQWVTERAIELKVNSIGLTNTDKE